MSAFEWFMLAALSLILFILVSTSTLFEPAGKTPDTLDRISAMEAHLDRIEGKLDQLLERQP